MLSWAKTRAGNGRTMWQKIFCNVENYTQNFKGKTGSKRESKHQKNEKNGSVGFRLPKSTHYILMRLTCKYSG